MATEVYYQSQVIKDTLFTCKGAVAFKMAHRFISGIPDLLIKVPEYPVILVEMKLVKFNSLKTRSIKVQTTELQRRFMQDFEMAGIHCEVWIVIEGGKNPEMIRAPYNSERVDLEEKSIVVRERGQKWPIMKFLSEPLKS